MLLTSRFSMPSVSIPCSGKYDGLDRSRHGCHIATGQSRHNHSPYFEPDGLHCSLRIDLHSSPPPQQQCYSRSGLSLRTASIPIWLEESGPLHISREPSPESLFLLFCDGQSEHTQSPTVYHRASITCLRRCHHVRLMCPPVFTNGTVHQLYTRGYSGCEGLAQR
jgi:hypothetical protein